MAQAVGSAGVIRRGSHAAPAAATDDAGSSGPHKEGWSNEENMTNHAVAQIVEALEGLTAGDVRDVRQALCDRLGLDDPPADGAGSRVWGGSPVPAVPAGLAHREMPE